MMAFLSIKENWSYIFFSESGEAIFTRLKNKIKFRCMLWIKLTCVLILKIIPVHKPFNSFVCFSQLHIRRHHQKKSI